MGAGFSLAMRDLEIRGAGNLLGTQQSGHIATVGYELYCRLLEQAVRGMKALPPAEPPAITIDLPGEAWLPRDYIADFRAKIDVYRRLSRATAGSQVDELAAELGDRFGPLPREARRLLDFTRLKALAAGLGIDSITRHPGMIVIGHHNRAAMEKLRLAAGSRGKTLRIVDQKTVVMPIDEATARRPMGAHKRDHAREILHYPDVAARARTDLAREPDEALLDEIYTRFASRLAEVLPHYAEPVPGAVATLQWLYDRDIRVASTTGYTRAMMRTLEPIAAAAGIATEALICADEVVQGRPAPWACFRLAEKFGVFPMTRCLKIGDTPADIAEGLNAGMVSLAVSESGNEVGLSLAALDALPADTRGALVGGAERRLLAAGASAVLRSVAELPAWIERQPA